MKIIQVKEGKKKYLDLLLLTDEQEDMVNRHLEQGGIFVLTDGTVRVECAVTKEGPGIYKFKSIATTPQFYRQGCGRRLTEHVLTYYPDSGAPRVGTGDSPLSLGFYHVYGLIDPHRVERFSIDNYDHPIIEGGIQLADIVYLKQERDMI